MNRNTVSYPMTKVRGLYPASTSIHRHPKVPLLQLRRPIHCSPSVALGQLTTGPSWLVAMDKPLARQERYDRNTFTRQRILCRNQPSIQLERFDRASRLSAVSVTSRPHQPAVPTARLQ